MARRFFAANAGLAEPGPAAESGPVAEVRPPRRGPRSPGVADCPPGVSNWPPGAAVCSADDRPEPVVEVAEPVGPGADTDAASSSLGAATAIPAPGAADNATPRTKAAAPARALVLLTAIEAPITANY